MPIRNMIPGIARDQCEQRSIAAFCAPNDRDAVRRPAFWRQADQDVVNQGFQRQGVLCRDRSYQDFRCSGTRLSPGPQDLVSCRLGTDLDLPQTGVWLIVSWNARDSVKGKRGCGARRPVPTSLKAKLIASPAAEIELLIGPVPSTRPEQRASLKRDEIWINRHRTRLLLAQDLSGKPPRLFPDRVFSAGARPPCRRGRPRRD